MAVVKFLRKATKNWLLKNGFRLVPDNRDAASLMNYVRTFSINTVIDVGANRGDTLDRWIKDFPNAQIHGLEPLPEMLKSLQSIQEKHPDRIKIWQVAASNSVSEVVFRVHVNHPSSSSLLPRTEESAELLDFTEKEAEILVKTVPIDDLLGPTSNQPVVGPILMKLDVQGAELKVLQGAVNVLEDTCFVICEINLIELYEDQSSFGEIFHFMTTQGFHLAGFLEQYSLPNGRAVYCDVLFHKEMTSDG